jgi:phosphohistidine phosphatase SixA
MRSCLLFFLAFLAIAPAQATEAGWALLREGGHVVLLRHAMAQGTTEPANFDIEACGTQRNLNDRGRQQARKIGALFAARAVPTDRVLSSRYCRAIETANLAFGASLVEPYPALEPVASDDEAALKAQFDTLMQEIKDYTAPGNLVMVTHQETINALIGAGAREGEAVIVRADDSGVRILGRIIFN